MIEVHPEYLIDKNSNKKAVLIPFTEWKYIIHEMEELDDIRAYDTAKSDEEYIPFEQAVNEIKHGIIK